MQHHLAKFKDRCEKKVFKLKEPFQIHFNPVGERIVGSFFQTRYDEDGRIDPILSERVYFYDFAKNFSVFRPVSNSGKYNKANSKDDKVRTGGFVS